MLLDDDVVCCCLLSIIAILSVYLVFLSFSFFFRCVLIYIISHVFGEVLFGGFDLGGFVDVWEIVLGGLLFLRFSFLWLFC